MNIKQFLVIKSCDMLPSDIRYLIWKYVKNLSANAIQNIYYLKVNRNTDIFIQIIRYKFDIEINKFIIKFLYYNKNNITYKFIQEPNIWILYLRTINYFSKIYEKKFMFDNKISCKFIQHIINKIKVNSL